MNLARSAGVAIGILIGLIIAVIIIRFANTNHKMKTEYDERQQEIRGRGYRLAFYAMMICEIIMFVLEIGNIPLPIEPYLAHFITIIVGAMALGSYCIWNDVYWGLNTNRKRYIVIFIAAALLNAIPVFGAASDGTLLVDGKFSTPLVNILVLIMLLVFGIELIAKEIVDRNAAREEE